MSSEMLVSEEEIQKAADKAAAESKEELVRCRCYYRCWCWC
jgi:hypothetical protein